MFKGYKYRIYPNEEQKKSIERYFGVSRLVYNLGLETKTTAYASRKSSVSKYDLIKQLTELRKEYDYIKECPCQVLQNSLIALDTAYKNFFKGKSRFPKFKNKYSRQAITFPQSFEISFKGGTIKLPKLKKIKTVYHREFVGVPKNVTLSKTPSNKYFVSILVNTESEFPEKLKVKEETAVGVDFGIRELAVTSSGVVYKNKDFFKSQDKKIRIERRSLSRKQKNSKNKVKQSLKVSLILEKIRNQRKDYLNKISSELVKNYDTIVLEDLAVANMIKNKNLSALITDMGWSELRSMIQYKCDWNGKNLVIIGRFEPSSKICSNCGNIKHKNNLSQKTYTCSRCKTTIDRDLNAAYNIKNFGVRDNPLYANVSQ